MKTLGYILIVIWVLDLVTSWVLENGSPLDPIVGYDIAPFTAYIFLGIGYFLKGLGSDNDEG